MRLPRKVLVWSALAGILALAPTGRADAPSNDEQLMLEMINRMRTNPQAELERLVNMTMGPPVTFASPPSDDTYVTAAINFFGVSASTLKTQWNALTPAPPLAWNSDLNDSATRYSELMKTRNLQAHNLDSHVNNDGTVDLIGRLEADGYQFRGGGSAGENIFAQSQSVFHAHAAFAIDWGQNPPTGIQNPPGHRDLIMQSQAVSAQNPHMREIGIGYVFDGSANSNTGPFVVTQHFAVSKNDGPFFTGVAYQDTDSNQFYTPGEGLGGITIVATRLASGDTYTTTTWASGGYSLKVDSGLFDIVAWGPGVGQRTMNNVLINRDTTGNVKIDIIPSTPPIPGDANMDGAVNVADVVILTTNLGKSNGAMWGQGNFDLDGAVTIRDLQILQAHLTTPSPSPGLPATAIPEPVSAILAAIGLLAIAGCSASTARRHRGN
jgi:uncharacterized protein YkwD